MSKSPLEAPQSYTPGTILPSSFPVPSSVVQTTFSPSQIDKELPPNQVGGSEEPTTSSSMVESTTEQIDFRAELLRAMQMCMNSLTQSDLDGDGYLDLEEFLKFVQIYSNCELTQQLTDDQKNVFAAVAGDCLNDPKQDYKCLVPGNERISIEAATGAVSNVAQIESLLELCSKIEATFGEECTHSPTIAPSLSNDLGWCAQALVKADGNSDRMLDISEYLVFMREYGLRELKELDLGLLATFYSRACECAQIPGISIDCCFPGNALVNISGAELSHEKRSSEQIKSLTRICTTANGLAKDRKGVESSSADPVYEACFENLLSSDSNSDGFINPDEYLSFARENTEICHDTMSLSVVERFAYDVLACLCIFKPGATIDCCFSENAMLDISDLPLSELEYAQAKSQSYSAICRASDASAQIGCAQFPPQQHPSSFQGDSPTSESRHIQANLIVWLTSLMAFNFLFQR
jgi:hypothetical protein